MNYRRFCGVPCRKVRCRNVWVRLLRWCVFWINIYFLAFWFVWNGYKWCDGEQMDDLIWGRLVFKAVRIVFWLSKIKMNFRWCFEVFILKWSLYKSRMMMIILIRSLRETSIGRQLRKLFLRILRLHKNFRMKKLWLMFQYSIFHFKFTFLTNCTLTKNNTKSKYFFYSTSKPFDVLCMV